MEKEKPSKIIQFFGGNPTGPSELQEKPAHREGDGGGANDKRTELQLERREYLVLIC